MQKLKPEIFTIPYDIVVMGNRSDYIAFFDRVCICEHRSFKHNMREMRSPDMMADQVTFLECGAWQCECTIFKQDNLRWLEEQSANRTSK